MLEVIIKRVIIMPIYTSSTANNTKISDSGKCSFGNNAPINLAYI